ncbi:MAG: cysteine-rich small domain-containing protein [Peptococcaceae bacterium]|nr:cysteine-rich small domain-containing protein [Peptococcaceae bacterium]
MGKKWDWKGKAFSFFQHRECEYFPCHRTKDPDEFNCLFCFCPLYLRNDCGGDFSHLENGSKNCSACLWPHRKDKYGLVMERLCRPMIGETERDP